MQLSKHFNSIEFACRCGCGGANNGEDMDPRLIELLEELRERVGRPLVLSCGYRCPKHNSEIGGASQSRHIYADACDIQKPKGISVTQLAFIAEDVGFDGIGIYDWGIHVDTRGYEARWDDRD